MTAKNVSFNIPQAQPFRGKELDIVFSITVSVYFLKASNQEKADMSVNLHKLMALGNRGFWNFRRKKGCNVNPELLPIPATGENLGITVFFGGFPVGSMVKNLLASGGDLG